MADWNRRRIADSIIAVLGFVLASATASNAYYLDHDQNISFRARLYSQASVRTQDSITGGDPPDTQPLTKAGQLIQNRNFYNPELDAKLTSYMSWMRDTPLGFLTPDDFTFRAAAWGFYDGVYDYGADQFGDRAARINSNFGNFSSGMCAGATAPDEGTPCTSNSQCSSGVCMPAGGWYLKGTKVHTPAGCPQNPSACFVSSLEQVFPDYEVRDPREVYGWQSRINELYLSYSKGPLFVRIGRQAISWGESDTIALLDQNNPFDLTLAAPGIFEDLDEARIPLWTIRTSYDVFRSWGPLSGGFLEAYWVPGDIDTNTGELPMLTASPYSPRGKDGQFSSGFPNETYQFILFDHQPEEKMSNSRWGVRAQTVVNRDYTVQAWVYTTFPSSPVPRHLPPIIVEPGSQGARISPPSTQCGAFSQQGCSPLFAVETLHELTTVYGLASTFFVPPLDGILRLEGEFFEHEPGFIPQYNLNIKSDKDRAEGIGVPGADSVGSPGTVPKADILRWEVGYDRFFFFRPVNPSNSFTLVMANVGQWNTSETSRRDFRYGGIRKIGKDVPGVNPVPDDFVQLNPVENFFQATLITDYMHGRLEPQLTYVQDVRGTYVIHPQLTYRYTDWLLFRADYTTIGGQFQGPGFFRDRDQVSLRVTYQLN